tara:strand:- start:517 stop:909 length:393 start_codon:yes stop_codon:yes gene_type:complete
MATLTPTLTLKSTDATSDALDFTVTDSLTTASPLQNLSLATAPSGSGNAIELAPSLDARRYLFVRHTGKDSGGSTVTTEVYVETAGGTWFSKLAAGEWMFLPINANGAQIIQCRATSGTVVVEYAYWTKG